MLGFFSACGIIFSCPIPTRIDSLINTLLSDAPLLSTSLLLSMLLCQSIPSLDATRSGLGDEASRRDDTLLFASG